MLATYRFCDYFAASAGIADSVGPTIDLRTPNPAAPKAAESYKTYMASVALTAPSGWGWLEGSSLYGGVVNGFRPIGGAGADTTSFYAGATVKTPITGLRVGAAYDYLGASQQPLLPANTSIWADAVAGYVSYQATEKLSLHARGEYFWRTDLGGIAKNQVVVGMPMAPRISRS